MSPIRTPSRRTVTLGLAAALLSACGGRPARLAAGPADTAPDPALLPQPNPGWDAWVAAFRGRAAARGISAATLDTAFADAGFLPGVIERDRNQTEFTRTLEDYLAIAASDERLALGRAAFARHRGALSAIEARYGVPAHVVAAVWGLESRYGTRMGDIPVVSATSTLAYEGRRGAFFEAQLMAALRILQSGDTVPSNMTGSWAGAMGHTQFIPTTYEAFAVDFTGDGRRDIWSDDPSDALASTANHFADHGWRQGQPWGMEVVLPAGLDAGLLGRGKTRAISDWNARGVRTPAGQPIPDYGSAAILVPQAGGPAFMAFRNFEVIARYNNAVSYVIGVGHLSDRLAGGPPLSGSFPPDAAGLTIADRKALQAGLNRAGFDAGTPDGVIGSGTRAAIEAYQSANGLPVTGTASRELLGRLR
ncbi:Membrane-bound lytic murein transglycosylase B [Oceanicola granulosus HTCC2516]|uniref:Membrane-bound lytic murein transglycosylase B n=1 Tax=Oceanicola granulosus (strain ATCC BAA-861 / DSM 15982 / KCTC 12143 / HTCC2516) TaxID=314256 RepID=Q2CIX4_OCEGH|nr:lytic murein transglycosylase [Oceanicola granulosus]EAR52465.1 Membrane-bound lytic murein transglycosylase B [Oceanicola granulosus HTCC2516]